MRRRSFARDPPNNRLFEIRAEQQGWFLVGLDIVSWLLWISITASFIERRKDELTLLGITALAAPHTIIIPTLITIINDLHNHCRENGTCSLDMPRIQWYIFPTLVVPYDVITFVYNLKVYPDEGLVFAAGLISLLVSFTVTLWSWNNGLKMWNVSTRVADTHAKLIDSLNTAPAAPSGAGVDL